MTPDLHSAPTPTLRGRSKTRPHRPWAVLWHRSCKQKKGAKIPERRQKPPLRCSLNLSTHFVVWVTVWVRQLTHISTHTIFSVFATKKHRKSKFSMLFGAGGVTRTHDLLITNQLLYRLSYTSTSIQMRVRVYHKVFYSSSNFPNFLKAAAKPSLPPLFHFLRRLRRMRLMWRSKSPLPMSSASTYCSKTGTVQE